MSETSRCDQLKSVFEELNDFEAKLMEIYRKQLTDKEIYCDECNKEIKNKKNVLVYHCMKKSHLHTEGWDICSDWVKKSNENT